MRPAGRFAFSLRSGERVVSVILLALSAAVIADALGMPAGTLGSLGPGAVPLILGALLALTSVGLLLRARRIERTESVEAGHGHVWLALVALAGLALLFEPAGYPISAAAFLIVLLRAYSALSWLACVGWSVLGAGLSFYFFVHVLGIALPSGPLPLR
jgi:putative tricarboxylic transport membrane protein